MVQYRILVHDKWFNAGRCLVTALRYLETIRARGVFAVLGARA